MSLLHTITAFGVFALLLVAAITDFRRWKIPNWVILALLAVYGAHLGVSALTELPGRFWSLDSLAGDAAAGGLLFVIGFVFWALGLFGAGDAKLLAAIGLYIGWSGMLPFAVLLGAGAVIALIGLKFPIPQTLHVYALLARLDEIRSSGKVPYGVIMVPAAMIVIMQRISPVA